MTLSTLPVDAPLAWQRGLVDQVVPAPEVALREALSGESLFRPEDTPQQKAALAEVVTRIIARAVAAGVVRDDFTFEDFGMVMCGVTSTMYYKPGGASWHRHVEIMLRGICAPVRDAERQLA